MKFAFLILFLKLFQQIVCNGPGTVFVQLILYQNPSGKTDAGKDCDSWFHQLVTDKCDLVFNICVNNAESKHPKSRCDVGFLSTLGHVFVDTQRVMFGSMIGFIPNPFNFTLPTMPDNVKIAINVTDDDAEGQEIISTLVHAIQLPILLDDDHSIVSKIVLSSKFSEISLKVFGRCAENYHGPGCRTYCKPSFSQESGHYACDRVSGEKHCLIGWTGVDCRYEDVCLTSNPCRGSSKCVMNGSVATCECPPTLTGRHCDTSKRPCDKNPCVNRGLCVLNNNSVDDKAPSIVCNCPLNFTGPLCQHDVNECSLGLHPCGENAANCVNTFGSYYCVCRLNYWGLHCEKPPVYSVLGLDGSYLYKNQQSSISQDAIIVLLVVVVCLLFLVAALAVLYVRKHRPSLMAKAYNCGSDVSVYSQCHYEDVDGKLKDVEFNRRAEEELRGDVNGNVYETQEDFNGHLFPIEEDKEDSKKCLSETVI